MQKVLCSWCNTLLCMFVFAIWDFVTVLAPYRAGTVSCLADISVFRRVACPVIKLQGLIFAESGDENLDTETCIRGQSCIFDRELDMMITKSTSSTELNDFVMKTYTIFFPRLIKTPFLDLSIWKSNVHVLLFCLPL